MENIKRKLHSLPAAMLVLLFVYTAVSKLFDIDKFRLELYRQVFPQSIAQILLYLLPIVELLTAGLIILPRTELAGLRLSLGLLVLFSGYVALTLFGVWDRVPCSCGGILSHLSWGAHLMLNLAFLCLNLIAINIHLKERRAEN